MEKIIVSESRPLRSKVTISGTKNSVIALIPAAILADSPVALDSIPDIQGIHSLAEILEIMGAKITFENNTLIIDPTEVVSVSMPKGKIDSLRASYYFIGSLLSWFGEGIAGLPDDCYLGLRPIDLHIKGFEALGAHITDEHGAMCLGADEAGLQGAWIFMDMVSTGATINVIPVAVKVKGKTIIENVVREPGTIDIATSLSNMSAKVREVGTDVIRIGDVEKLHGCRHSIIPDRIGAGTYLTMAATMGEGIRVRDVIYEHLESFIVKLQGMGVKMTIEEDMIEVHPSHDLKMTTVKTYPYPSFATDLQQPLTPLFLRAQGTGKIIDTVYTQRNKRVPELVRMRAGASVEGSMIILNGPNQLHGIEVVASDLRTGACLVTAGLVAEGTTTIYNIKYISRGYNRITEKLTALGTNIQVLETEEQEGLFKVDQRATI